MQVNKLLDLGYDILYSISKTWTKIRKNFVSLPF